MSRLSLNESQGRFKDAPFALKLPSQKITIGGVGGIGSWLSVILAKMGVEKLEIWDFDDVEEHNIGGQLFRVNQRGENKTLSMAANITTFSQGVEVSRYDKFQKENHTQPVTFAVFDNMKSRKDMFDSWSDWLTEEKQSVLESRKRSLWRQAQIALELEPERYEHLADVKEEDFEHEPIFIDVRMSAEQIHVGIFDKNNADQYEKYWFDDNDVDDGPCTYKSTTFTGSMAASLAATAFANKLAGRPTKDFTEFVLPQVFI